MSLLKDMPLRHKLMLSILLTSVIVMVLMRATFFMYELFAMRRAMVQQLSTLGEITASNSTGALAFENHKDAQEILAALRADHYVTAAAIYDRNGALFASYPQSMDADTLPSAPGDAGYRLENSRLEGFAPIDERDRRLGTLYLRYDTGALMRDWLVNSLWLALAVMGFVLLIAYVISRALERQISRPILELADTAKGIADRQDFAVRARKYGRDEIGRLTDHFNDMLAGIQQRESALQAANDALRGEHRERLAAQQQLARVQKMEAVGQLTGGLAHDFNNILGAIIGNLDIARESMPAGSVAAGCCDAALDAALSAGELVKRLLAFSRRQPLHPKPTDLAAVVASVSPLIVRTLGEHVHVTTTSQTGGWLAMADADQIESAILNLAINARDAMPAGGDLKIELKAVAVDETYASATEDLKLGDYLLLAISDTGTGMPADVVARAFDPFFTTKAPGAGSGLGLSMVFGTMKQLGGTAKIYSEVDVGTTVQLYLPRALEPAQSPSSEARAESVRGGGERILMVEDNVLIREVSAATLRSLGYEVTVAENADAALHLVESGKPFDLLFSDVVMSGRLNGIALARELRARRPDVPVLLTSGFSSPISAGRDLADVDAEFIAKPYRKADLARSLRTLLDKRTPAGN